MRKRDGGPFISLEGLEDLRERASYLGKYVFADALQVALNEVSERAVDELGYRWSGAIEGGAVPFADIRPGRKTNAVVARKRKGATKGVAEASVVVRDKQSAFLKYQLGEADTRPAGDVGAAKFNNLVPVPDTLQNALGIKLTKQGNLPKNALKRLSEVAKQGKIGSRQEQGRDEKGRFKNTAEGQRHGNVFFGLPTDNLGKRQKRNPKARAKGKGFWWRPKNRLGRLRPLAFAVERSRYPNQSLVPVWNESMNEAAEDLPAILRPIIEREVESRFTRRHATYYKHLHLARQRRSNAAALRQIQKERELAAKGLTPEMIAASKEAQRKAKRAAYDARRRAARKASRA